jgi:hypothetical protein
LVGSSGTIRFGWQSFTSLRLVHLFDHVVGTADQRERHGDAECLGSLEVYDQLDFRDLLDRKLRRLLSFEDASGKYAELAIDVCNAGS